MRNLFTQSTPVWKVLGASLLLLLLMLLAPRPARAQEIGNYCVWDY